MSENKLQELLKKVGSDPEARKKVEDLKKPADEKGAIAYYLEVSKRLGVTLTEEDIRQALAEMLKERQGKTDAAAEKVEAMSEEALAEVSGGKYGNKCKDTYQKGEHCWFNDDCDFMINRY